MKVCQCWDDGVYTDVRLTELFRKYHAKATFNLCPGNMKEKSTPSYWLKSPFYGNGGFHGFKAGNVGTQDIQAVYDGFELASHCWHHEVAGNVPDDVFIESAVKARHFLEDIVQRECRGFAWPCGRYTPSTIELLRQQGFAYARTVENTNDVSQNPEPLKLASCCHFLAGNFWDRFEAAKKTGIFYFWGHSYEMYQYDALWNGLEEKIKILSEDPSVEWVNVIDIVPFLK